MNRLDDLLLISTINKNARSIYETLICKFGLLLENVEQFQNFFEKRVQLTINLIEKLFH